jgi:hypothetical protein
MGRLEMVNHRSDSVTLVLTLYEAGLALCAMYYLAICINQLIPESLSPTLYPLTSFSPNA